MEQIDADRKQVAPRAGESFVAAAGPSQEGTAAGCPLPMVGRLWIEAGTGQILKTELVAGGTDHVTTTFEFDDRFEIAMPHEMHESFVAGRSAVEGRATYGQFRRFTVTTGEQVGKTP